MRREAGGEKRTALDLMRDKGEAAEGTGEPVHQRPSSGMPAASSPATPWLPASSDEAQQKGRARLTSPEMQVLPSRYGYGGSGGRGRRDAID